MKKRLVKASCLILAGAAVFVWTTNLSVLHSADGRVYTKAENLPSQTVALVLGTSPMIANGNKNLFFERRMNAAAKLYKAGKTKKILVSGDNGSPYYDEPTAMQEALIKRGIPKEDIALDYAGFRTLDSVIRAHKVFGVEKCVIVTDDFHLPRALFVAEEEGIDAVGFQTDPLPMSVSPQTYLREVAARSMMWVDVQVLNRQPKFLGPKESI
ncbi:MAG: YdcF family protein [Chlorobia bacterium]|nr:YdcF family protein [Fimbriimonadaceae bacterium]